MTPGEIFSVVYILMLPWQRLCCGQVLTTACCLPSNSALCLGLGVGISEEYRQSAYTLPGNVSCKLVLSRRQRLFSSFLIPAMPSPPLVLIWPHKSHKNCPPPHSPASLKRPLSRFCKILLRLTHWLAIIYILWPFPSPASWQLNLWILVGGLVTRACIQASCH